MVLGSRLAPEAEVRRLSLVLVLVGHHNEALLRKACEQACFDVVGVCCSLQRDMSPQVPCLHGAEATVLNPESSPS